VQPPIGTPPGPTQVNTADLAIPSAEEIVLDIASSMHWSRHQRGEVNGYRYVLFPDGTATVMQSSDKRVVLFQMKCTTGISCEITDRDGPVAIIPAVGGPKPTVPNNPNGEVLTRYLAEWVLAGTGAPAAEERPETPRAEPIKVADSTPSESGEVATARPPTTDQASDEPNEVATQQTELHVANGVAPDVCTEQDPFQPAICDEPAPSVSAQSPVPQRVFRAAKTATRPEPPKRTSQSEPAAEVQTAFPQRETFAERIKLNCSVTASATLRYRHHESSEERPGKPRMSLGCGARLTPKLSLRFSLIGYLDPSQKSPSDADFSYALSYRATDKLSFNYSNYTARFGNSENPVTSGSIRANYRLPKIPLPFDKSASCSASVNLPNPRDGSLNLSCGYAVTKNLRVGATAYAYFSGQQGATDPDFSYTASYRIADNWLVSYSNYGNNRFPWNKSNTKGLGILGGSLSVNYKFKF
jgi:hypothetical protein